jgi:transposase
MASRPLGGANMHTQLQASIHASPYTICNPLRLATPKPKPMNTNPQQSWAALIGFDWGDSKHAIAIRFGDQPPQTLLLEHSPESLHAWLDQLHIQTAGRPVALAIEASRGPVVHALIQRPWIHIFPVHPATSSHQRKAFKPSGAKDDIPDALLLLSILENHQDKLRPLNLEDPLTRTLDGLCRARRKAVDQRTDISNQLTSLLKDFFPQALQWCGSNLWSPMALDFLSKWNCLAALKTSKPSTIKRFYLQHNVRSASLLDQRLQQIKSAVPLTSDSAVLDVSTRVLNLLIDQLRTLQKHIQLLEQVIATTFAQHPERSLFMNLPGAGQNLAPRLLCAFGTDRSRLQSAADLQRSAGVAPVKEGSGKKTWIHWRWNAPTFLRQSLVEWAAQTVTYSHWARAYYQQQRAKGSGHWATLRALAFKWLRILWRCWINHSLYNEETYLRSLEKRKSPIAATARSFQLAATSS